MKPKNISDALNDIDFDMVEEAESAEKRFVKRKWLRWGSIAACMAVVVAAGAFILPMLNDSGSLMDGIERKYKDVNISAGEIMIEWPWEYQTVFEQYTAMTWNGTKYHTRAREVSSDLLGESLGICRAEGWDTYTEKLYESEFEVREIRGVDSEHMVAVNLDGRYYVFIRDDNSFPAAFGEFMDTYALSETLPFTRFSVNEGHKTKGYFVVNDDAYIWQILSECRDAERISDDTWNRGDRNYISFTATSEALGVYKNVFYVSEDGYVWTNIMNYAYLFDIGEEAAGKIITYAKENSAETVFEPYYKSIGGTVTEIGDAYVLIDDSILCADADDGMVFKVLTDDLRISRCINLTPYSRIEVGDTVMVEYTGTIDISNDNTVTGAFSISKGTIVDGGIAIPE